MRYHAKKTLNEQGIEKNFNNFEKKISVKVKESISYDTINLIP